MKIILRNNKSLLFHFKRQMGESSEHVPVNLSLTRSSTIRSNPETSAKFMCALYVIPTNFTANYVMGHAVTTEKCFIQFWQYR